MNTSSAFPTGGLTSSKLRACLLTGMAGSRGSLLKRLRRTSIFHNYVPGFGTSRSLRSNSDAAEFVAKRVTHDIDDGMSVELSHNRGAMRLDCFGRHS
jgi:hypothetical protein